MDNRISLTYIILYEYYYYYINQYHHQDLIRGQPEVDLSMAKVVIRAVNDSWPICGEQRPVSQLDMQARAREKNKWTTYKYVYVQGRVGTAIWRRDYTCTKTDCK